MLGLFGEFNDANLLFLGGIPRWVIWSLAALGLAFLAFSWYDLRDLRGRRRWVLLTLRALAVVAALLLTLEPALELRHVTRIKNNVVFLVDSSLSMSLPDRGTATRWDRAVAAMEQFRPLIETPSEEHRFEVARFDAEVRPSSLEDVTGGPDPSGQESRILEALEALAERYPREELGGVVLISDGADSGQLGGRVRPGERLDAATRRFIESMGTPIHAIQVGDPGRVRDLSIERVLVDDFAFVRNRVSIEVVVRAIGFTQGLLPVTLRRQGAVLQTREVLLQPGQGEYHLSFEFVPEQIGKEIYSVSIPVLADELLAENNDAFFALKVIRDKIRVLQVCGRPSWDERFLREMLKRNPNVDLISFFILRTDANLQFVPNNELSLIPFPTEELFEEQLGSFDLVIFQNFTYRPYGMYRYLGRILEYVQNGGAFLMVGGEQAFASGGYTGTPVANLLPVFLGPEGPLDLLVDTEPFQPTLTAAGQRHPITQLAFNRTENVERWAELPELEGTNLVLAPRPEATVLLEHPDVTAGGEPLAVLSVMEFGEGRTMALTSDSSWRWSFANVGQGGTSREYNTLWNNAIRWLIQDPELKLIKVEAPQGNVEPGQPFEVTIRVFRPDYEPAAGISGEWRLTRRPLAALGDPRAAERVAEAAFTTDDRGRVDLELTVEAPGAYELEAVADLGETGEIADADLFLALRDSRELRDILPRPDLLEALAEASGGELRTGAEVAGGDFDPDDLEFAEARTVQVNRRRILDVWNTPWVLGFFGLLFAAEWMLRRRWGRL